MRARGPATVVAASLAVLVALLVGMPLVRLGQVVWEETHGDVAAALVGADLAAIARATVLLAAAVTLTAVPLGTAMALVLRHPDLPGRSVLRAAVLLPVVPFSLELLALRRLTSAAFGTLMSLEPAIALLVGLVALGQVPGAAALVGVAFVVVAGIGAERTGRRATPPGPPVAP